MAKDVRIIPADGTLTFYNTAGTGSGLISVDGNNLVFSNPTGDVLFGDTDSDVYIGDGVNSVDIVFEQNGSIRAEDGSSAVITLGSPGTTLQLTGSVLYNGVPSVGVVAPTVVTKDGSNIVRINLSDNRNFIVSASGGYSFDVTVPAKTIGQAGSIIIKNTATTTPAANLPSNLKTPGGRSIAWQTDAGDVAVLSYLVVDTGTVIVNYIGDFG